MTTKRSKAGCLKVKFRNVPKPTDKFAEIPVGRVVNDLLVIKNIKGYKVLNRCEVKTPLGVVETHVLSLKNRFIIVHQRSLVVSDKFYPDMDFIRLMDIKDGSVLDVIVSYTFDFKKRLVGNVKYSIPRNTSLVSFPHPMTPKCSREIAKFIPLIRVKRIKKVALKGIK